MKITSEIDKKLSRIEGMVSQMDYIVNDMLDAVESKLNPNDRFYDLHVSHDRRSLNNAIPVLDNLREDMMSIKELLEKVYAPVSRDEAQ